MFKENNSLCFSLVFQMRSNLSEDHKHDSLAEFVICHLRNMQPEKSSGPALQPPPVQHFEKKGGFGKYKIRFAEPGMST